MKMQPHQRYWEYYWQPFKDQNTFLKNVKKFLNFVVLYLHFLMFV